MRARILAAGLIAAGSVARGQDDSALRAGWEAVYLIEADRAVIRSGQARNTRDVAAWQTSETILRAAATSVTLHAVVPVVAPTPASAPSPAAIAAGDRAGQEYLAKMSRIMRERYTAKAEKAMAQAGSAIQDGAIASSDARKREAANWNAMAVAAGTSRETLPEGARADMAARRIQAVEEYQREEAAAIVRAARDTAEAARKVAEEGAQTGELKRRAKVLRDMLDADPLCQGASLDRREIHVVTSKWFDAALTGQREAMERWHKGMCSILDDEWPIVVLDYRTGRELARWPEDKPTMREVEKWLLRRRR